MECKRRYPQNGFCSSPLQHRYYLFTRIVSIPVRPAESNIHDYSCTGAVELTSKVKTHNVWRHGVCLWLKRLWRLEVADLGSEQTLHAATYITFWGSQIVPLTEIMCTCSNKSCRQDMHRCGPSLCVCLCAVFQVSALPSKNIIIKSILLSEILNS